MSAPETPLHIRHFIDQNALAGDSTEIDPDTFNHVTRTRYTVPNRYEELALEWAYGPDHMHAKGVYDLCQSTENPETTKR